MIRVFLLLVLAQTSWAAPIVVRDLHGDWLTYLNDRYLPYGDGDDVDVRTIYFSIGPSSFKGQNLSVSAPEEWSLFVNRKLISSGKKKIFSVDSLSRIYPGQLFFAVYSSTGVNRLSTAIVSPDVTISPREQLDKRRPTFFRDYGILASAALLLFFLGLFRTNPQLTLDYFSFAKIFSVQERNENLLASRITSSANLLFYVFCALLTGFLLSAVFYTGGSYFLVSRFVTINSFGAAFGVWIRLSLFILLLLAAKLVIVLFFSSLFNFRETVSFQFFNFLRFVLFTSVVMALLSLGYFVFKGDQSIFYERLVVLSLLLLSAGSVMVLIKLLARAPFSFFHLFSYLCASEIIPLVIIIKIFF
ncbi:MAG TPA: DUF4271 domain-containing protein [Cyclobacteriaceae bacterium]|nr:DUF4271 domain-containing protein [Cyclobacteriaceae bacterium]